MTLPARGRDPGGAASSAHDADVEQLRAMGYAQELRRRMSAFSNFAISFSTICVVAGGITSLQLGTSAVGGAAAGVIWPLGVAFSLVVALCMAQVASAFPTAGGLYHWSSILGGKGWGWATAWFNLGGLVFVTAAVNVGAYGLFVNFVGPLLGIDPARLGLWHQLLGVAAIVVSHALFNHFGIRVTTLLTDFSGYLIGAVTLLLTVVMLRAAPAFDAGRLFTFVNLSGGAGGNVWPAHDGVSVMVLLALMWPVYTITGFDASAHTSEETVQAARNVPKGMLRSVYLSGLVGWVMVVAFVLAMPDVEQAAAGRGCVRVADEARGARAGGHGAVGGHRRRELSVRAGVHDVDVAHDVRLRARRRTALVAGHQPRICAPADTGGGHLDDGWPGAGVNGVRARVLDVDGGVRGLPLPVVRDADHGRSAGAGSNLDPHGAVRHGTAHLPRAGRRLDRRRGAAGLDRRAASEPEGLVGAGGDGGSAAGRLVAGGSAHVPGSAAAVASGAPDRAAVTRVVMDARLDSPHAELVIRPPWEHERRVPFRSSEWPERRNA